MKCRHKHTRVTKYPKSNGIMSAVRQCTDCGAYVRDLKKDEHYHDDLPWFDEDLRLRNRQQVPQGVRSAIGAAVRELDRRHDTMGLDEFQYTMLRHLLEAYRLLDATESD